MPYLRPQASTLLSRLQEPRRFIQALLGPRQVGKTTLVLQVLKLLDWPHHYASADAGTAPEPEWIEAHWLQARALARETRRPVVLVLDEIQKIRQWSGHVKREWDRDAAEGNDLRLVLTGSSSALVGGGLTESLAGRFEVIRMGHWQYSEMREAFGFDLERFILLGGYPGGAALADDPKRWRDYVRDSLIESVLGRDILMTAHIAKPVLLRKLLTFACEYGGQTLSYQKMLGQIVEAGHTATLAGYQQLLDQAWLVKGLQKWSGNAIRKRNSAPKWLPLSTTLMTAIWDDPFESLRGNPDRWGRLVEVAVGNHLFLELLKSGGTLHWWREGNDEVDYVAHWGDKLLAVEVKSGRARPRQGLGLAAFAKAYPHSRRLLVGGGGVPLEAFFTSGLDALL